MAHIKSIINNIFEDCTLENLIVFVDQINDESDVHKKIALLEAKKYGASAVFFRKYKRELDGKIISTPIVYIYDNTGDEILGTDLGEIHKKLWNTQSVFLYLVINKTSIRFYNPHKAGLPAHFFRPIIILYKII